MGVSSVFEDENSGILEKWLSSININRTCDGTASYATLVNQKRSGQI